MNKRVFKYFARYFYRINCKSFNKFCSLKRGEGNRSAAVIRFCLDFKATPNEKSHNC